ncbi:MAG TPA: response regulator [Candidatus Limnocylindria bacterium]|nr:response regulator [Candidatus Limnocylindria bacterium]
MRILVVEDHAPTTELLAEILGGDGHTVIAERDGLAGRERALSESFDLILCDIGLPGLDGLALARAIRAAGIAVPLLALSGRTSDDERLVGLTAGFDNYLTKPITASALLREIAVQEASMGWRRAAPGASRAPTAAHMALPTAEPVAAARPRRRGVLGGLVVIAMGLPFVLQPLGVPNAASYLFLAMGAAFLISYLRGHQYVYLIPMVTLSSFGIALLLPTWIVMRPEAIAPAFVAIVALGFVAAFVLAPERRWPLVPAGLLGVVAASRLVTGSSPIPGPLEPFLVPIVLVGVGVYLLVERQE